MKEFIASSRSEQTCFVSAPSILFILPTGKCLRPLLVIVSCYALVVSLESCMWLSVTPRSSDHLWGQSRMLSCGNDALSLLRERQRTAHLLSAFGLVIVRFLRQMDRFHDSSVEMRLLNQLYMPLIKELRQKSGNCYKFHIICGLFFASRSTYSCLEPIIAYIKHTLSNNEHNFLYCSIHTHNNCTEFTLVWSVFVISSLRIISYYFYPYLAHTLSANYVSPRCCFRTIYGKFLLLFMNFCHHFWYLLLLNLLRSLSFIPTFIEIGPKMELRKLKFNTTYISPPACILNKIKARGKKGDAISKAAAFKPKKIQPILASKVDSSPSSSITRLCNSVYSSLNLSQLSEYVDGNGTQVKNTGGSQISNKTGAGSKQIRARGSDDGTDDVIKKKEEDDKKKWEAECQSMISVNSLTEIPIRIRHQDHPSTVLSEAELRKIYDLLDKWANDNPHLPLKFKDNRCLYDLGFFQTTICNTFTYWLVESNLHNLASVPIVMERVLDDTKKVKVTVKIKNLKIDEIEFYKILKARNSDSNRTLPVDNWKILFSRKLGRDHQLITISMSKAEEEVLRTVFNYKLDYGIDVIEFRRITEEISDAPPKKKFGFRSE